jgi:hypothetical protein
MDLPPAISRRRGGKGHSSVRQSVERVLVRNGRDAEHAASVAQVLTEGRWTHDYAITVEEAHELGLPVKRRDARRDLPIHTWHPP